MSRMGVGGASRSLSALLFPAKTDTPTLEELTAELTVAATIAASASYPIFTAPFDCKITAGMLCTWNNAIAQSDVNYWTFQLNRYRAGVANTIASWTTRVTNGVALATRTGYSFDAVPFDAGFQQLVKGDVLGLGIVMTGAPTSLSVLQATARYEPT